MPYPDQQKDTPIPPALDRWNWGAFFLNWIWGLGNSTYIALLIFVPFVNLVMVFVLGAKGSKWAWKNRLWADEAHFIRTQRNWARAGLIVFVVVTGFVVFMFIGLSSLLRNNEAYIQSMELMRSNQQVIAIMGEPIVEHGMLTGNVSVTPSSGVANFDVPVKGPNCSGTLFSRAEKSFGQWHIYLLVFHADCTGKNIVLINERNVAIPDVNRSGIDL